jgi:hypothetical protein
MSMTHWLRLELDEETGALTARQFCAASYGPKGKERDAIVHEDVPVPAETAELLKKAIAGVIEANRAKVEREARKARAGCELYAELHNEFEDEPEGADADEAETTDEPA